MDKNLVFLILPITLFLYVLGFILLLEGKGFPGEIMIVIAAGLDIFIVFYLGIKYGIWSAA